MSRRRNRAMAGAGLSLGAALGVAGQAQAAVFEVDTLDDDATLTACTVAPDDCSLRGAIADANGDALADDITFDATLTGAINLQAGVGYGRLEITEPVDIQGPGAVMPITVSGGDATALFRVAPATPGDDVRIAGLTLADGFADGENGAGISSADADLTIEDAILTGNTVGVAGMGNDSGGAIFTAKYAGPSSLTITDSTITGNNAPEDLGSGAAINSYGTALSITGTEISDNHADGQVGFGGGIYAYDANVELTRSVVSGNTANGTSGITGGIYANDGPPPTNTFQVETSTISGNQGTGPGAGIYAFGHDVTVENSTFSGNDGDYYGGGLAAVFGDLTVRHSTFAQNSAYGGGGIAAAVTYGTLENTIVADNTASAGPDLFGDFDLAFSLVENTAGNPGVINTTIAGSNIAQDPQLGPLADNGGQDAGAPGMMVPIETRLPADSSFAVDCGRSFGAAEDQRGLTRPVLLPPPNSTAMGADGADIGAVELQTLGGPGRTAACFTPPPPPPPPPPPNTPGTTPQTSNESSLQAAIRRCKKRFHGKKRKKCIKKARGKAAKAALAQPGWPEPRSRGRR